MELMLYVKEVAKRKDGGLIMRLTSQFMKITYQSSVEVCRSKQNLSNLNLADLP